VGGYYAEGEVASVYEILDLGYGMGWEWDGNGKGIARMGDKWNKDSKPLQGGNLSLAAYQLGRWL